MAFGIRVRNAEGLVTFDTTVRTIRHTSSVVIPPNTSGSIDVSGYSRAQFMLVAYSTDGSGGQMPYPVLNGTTLGWNGAAQPCILVLGIYS